MQMSITGVIVISLSSLVCDWVGGKVAPSIDLGDRQTKSYDSDVYTNSKQRTSNDSSTELSLKNTRSGRWRSTREAAVKFDSPTKTVSTEYALEFKNVSTDNVLPTSLIRKIVSILGKKPTPGSEATDTATATIATGEPNKQLFGGRLPPFIERIIQRIQNYFSVYNPPEYFEGNRPPPSSLSATQHATIALICTNTTSGQQSCGGTSSYSEEEEEEQQQQQQEEEDDQQDEISESCDGGSSAENSGNVDVPPRDEYNVVVTHTVVQDSSLNVYSSAPALEPVPLAGLTGNAAAESTHMVSNVVVILEPAAGQYSPPPLDNPDKNKFYVYVNPTSANKNQQRLKTWNESVADSDADANAGAAADDNKTSEFKPFVNATYTVIIRGDKLQEYSTDLQNDDSNWSNPEIAIYVRNSTQPLKKCKLPFQPVDTATNTKAGEAPDCDRSVSLDGEPVAISRSADSSENERNDDGDETIATETKNNENSNKVPNIDLLLVPPKERPSKAKNKTCASKKKIIKNPQLQYYVLKPDNGVKAKTDDKGNATFYLQKTSIGTATPSPTYLPPSSASAPVPVFGSLREDQPPIVGTAGETSETILSAKNNDNE